MPVYDRKQVTFGHLKGLLPDASVLQVLMFLERHLEEYPHRESISSISNEKDKLLEEYKRPLTAKFISENSRKTSRIILIHLWVNLVKIPGNGS